MKNKSSILNNSNSIVYEAEEFDDQSSKRSSKLDSDSELDSAGDVSSDGGGEYIDIPIITDIAQGQNSKAEDNE